MNAPIKRERRYERAGLLALDPHAFLSFFMLGDPPRENTMIGDVEVVDVRGPLEQHAGGWCDSYEAVRDRVRAACDSQSKAIVLRIDSPGGEVAGVFSAARAIRAAADASGKPLWAFVEGRAHSAGYALACAAERIVLTDTATVGSIGVINTRPDYTGRDAATGMRYAVTASGARKTDGHPHVAVTEGELKASQAIVDEMAGVFFELVGEMRGLTPAAVQATEAGVFTGQGAIAAGLADDVGTFDEAVAAIVADGKETAMAAKTLGQTMRAGDYEDGRSALERAAKGEGKQAEAAKRALAAMDEEPKPKDEDKKDDAKKADDEGDKPKDEDKKDDAKKADDEGDKPKDEDKKDDAKSSARSSTSSTVEERLSRLEASSADGERAALLATRPDITPELAKALATKSPALVKEILDATAKRPVSKLAASQSVTGTRGADIGAPAPSAEASEMDRRMGLVPEEMTVRRSGNVVQFGVFPKEPAAAAGGDGGAK